MVPNELREELRGTWGPPPNGPEYRAIWEESMEQLAGVPQLLAEAVRRDGTPFDSLIKDLGSLEALLELEVQCVKRYLCSREEETIGEVVRETIELPPWTERLKNLNAVRKSRFKQRLGEEIANKLTIVVIGNSKLRKWFFANE